MVAQIQSLHLRLFGNHIEPDGLVEANLRLADLYEVSLTNEIVVGLLTVLLRDPDFLFTGRNHE